MSEEHKKQFRRNIQQCESCSKKYAVVLHAIGKYVCDDCKTACTHSNLSVPKICEKCANNRCRWCLNPMD